MDALEALPGHSVTVSHGVRVHIAVTVTLAARFLAVRLTEPAVNADVALVTWRTAGCLKLGGFGLAAGTY